MLLEGKPPELVALYAQVEKIVGGFAGVEILTRGRYALFRTTRIFADLVFMKDALRLAILLDRTAGDPIFFKVGRMSRTRIGHVARITKPGDVRAVVPYLREAWRFARSEDQKPLNRRARRK